ncbi:hypothetical protein JZ751_025626 [Albula glossodonta]|uniref:Small ribosomal subunit protein mS39 n=1 Tax=Albula glossodonta TaxID=121402 RepID=A0A8T2NLV6_9TELE|nr:hypothetical protein JZ751_025626 [Albula glossodonta]
MAAPLAQAGLCVHRSKLVIKKLQQLCLQRSFAVSSALSQQAADSKPGSTEEIVIPKKKTWDKLAVLQALSSTVNRDPTAPHYMFQDDPYLTPRTSTEFKIYSLSLESGRSAAKYIVNSYPKYFQKEYAEPHIPCLMPQAVEPLIEDVSEAALAERIQLRKVVAAIDLYDQLLQAGTAVSTEVTNDLLDLICFYGDADPKQSEEPEKEAEELQDETPKKPGRGSRKAADLIGRVWRQNNNAERIFKLMPEKNSRAYCALIRGMVKYGAFAKAFETYTDMLNNRLSADVHTFNALIRAAPEVRELYSERWELVLETLKHMEQQKVRPNLLTFNAVLKSLRLCGGLGKSQALTTLGEMKALGITATYRNPNKIISEVIDELSGKSFTVCDPDDVLFFSNAMRVCLDLKDMELGYRLHACVEEGDNCQLLGEHYQKSIYYGRFFNLLCMMENVDNVLKWYRELIPSLYFPNSNGLRDLLQALDTDNRLELIPEIWKDIKQLGHANKESLVEEVLALMARDKHSPEVQQSFADCALAVKQVYEQGDGGRTVMNWTTSALGNITSILLAANRTQQAWTMLQLFKKHNRVPAEALLEDFVSSAQSTSSPQLAVQLVQLSHSFSLPVTARLAHRVAQEFQLSEAQKKTVSALEASESSESSDSESSDSDSDTESSKK